MPRDGKTNWWKTHRSEAGLGTGSSCPFWSESGRRVEAGAAGPIVGQQFVDYRDLAAADADAENTK
jgi:hypothetical protein